jgi:hypothetical protein
VPVSGENVDHLRLKWITPVAFRPFFRRHLMIHMTFYILAHKSSAITNKHHCKQLEGLNRGLRQDIDQMIFQNGQVFFIRQEILLVTFFIGDLQNLLAK